MKKVFSYILILITIMFSFQAVNVEAKTLISNNVNLLTMDYEVDYTGTDDLSTNCEDFAKTIRTGGVLLVIAKVMIPLIIIVKATLNLVSVVTKGDPGELKKQAQKVGTAIIAGIVIFFIPTIINTIFGFVDRYNNGKTADSEICRVCIFEPFSDDCTKYTS
jgi:hypothetical protein